MSLAQSEVGGSARLRGAANREEGQEGRQIVNLNWDDLRVLLAIVRSGSLTRAATQLGIDQSTAGRRLSALEAALGTTLFLRSKVGILPTEVGEKLIVHAMEIERRADTIAEVAAAPESGPVGQLQIKGEHWVLEQLAMRFLPPFTRAHPQMSLRLSSGPPMSSAWTAATISLWFEDPPQMGEFAIKLAEVPFAVYAPRGLNHDDLPWLSMMDESSTRRAPAKFLEKMRKPEETLQVTANDARLVRSAIAGGLGKGLLPVCLAAQDPQLQRIDAPDYQLTRVLHLHAHPDTVQTLRVQTAIRWLRERAADVFCHDASQDSCGMVAPLDAPGRPRKRCA
ncbi:LysR family transcriptional regulator [Roseobacter cerasinus]|uniref:LysR family transcriptional regulator n=1 Tax=Roseobacter cerasinus TaxID=2602289 RepID=A0A640VNP8_9RHOB|nr:LysR family transcriptional regulator [Roseobacter cerasinus]GFE49863.1 LysR family transcriptional regulator [Roseobacter cerasinus]